MDNQNSGTANPANPEKTTSLFAPGAAQAASAGPAPGAPGLIVAATPPVVAPVEAPPEMPNEREMLMSRARLMNIEFSNNIGTDTLRARIEAKMDGLPDPEAPKVTEPAAAAVAPVVETNALTGAPSNYVETRSLRQQLHDEQMRLVRVRVTCMDPKKADLPGEIFTLANEYLGTVRKFVPFGEFTDDGFHVPFCIYTMMEERRFQNIRTRKDKRTGQLVVETNYAREFALEILPPLTEAEIERLAIAQTAAGSIDSAGAE